MKKDELDNKIAELVTDGMEKIDRLGIIIKNLEGDIERRGEAIASMQEELEYFRKVGMSRETQRKIYLADRIVDKLWPSKTEPVSVYDDEVIALATQYKELK